MDDPHEEVITDFSEDGLAIQFSRRVSEKARFVGKLGRWFVYHGRNWEVDDRLSILESVMVFLRGVARKARNSEVQRLEATIPLDLSVDQQKEKRRECIKRAAHSVMKMKTTKMRDSIVSMARHKPLVAASVDQWDADPYLLNTPAGTIDLKRGVMREHRATDYVTKMAACGLTSAPPRLWLEFLRTITDGDSQLEGYLKRVFGYCITGGIEEHAMFFGYGSGTNGKSVLVNTVADILGTYAKVADVDMFVQTPGSKHPTDVANLHGARFVSANETDAGRRWAEAKIKLLTGGTKVSARFMRQDFFEYAPQFKLFITGNHKPALSCVDEAIRRRFNLITFPVRIPKSKLDIHLAARLREEWSSILNWMVEGCVEWQSGSLRPPSAVTEATTSYFSMEDNFTSWFDECCTKDANARSTPTELFNSWKHWTVANDETTGSQKMFSQTMMDRGDALGIKYGKSREGRYFQGVLLTGKPGPRLVEKDEANETSGS